MKKRFLSFALYALPVIFFLISYLTMLASGEDIFQGAATPPNIFGDALAAFHHSARLADMYAWSVINFYTYSVSLGSDLFLRLFDVFAVFSLFYLCTFFVLRRRPRFRLKDSLVFSSLFLLVLLTQNGRILYSGFSGIHNYLFISLSTLLFFLPIFRLIYPHASSVSPLSSYPLLAHCFSFARPLGLFLLAFIFAFSSNVTALIFLLTLALFLILNFILTRKFPKSFTPVNKNFLFYLLPTLPGLLLGLALIYLVGDGLSDYSADPTYLASYDYVSFSALFSSPLSSSWQIIKHISWNFFRFFFPLVLFSLPPFLYFLSFSSRPSLNSLFASFSKRTRTYLLALSLFTLVYLLSFSQLYLPTRLALPAYLTACITLLCLFRQTTSKTFATKATTNSTSPVMTSRSGLRPSKITIASVINITLCLILISIRTYFSLDYRSRVIPLLNQIQTSPASSLCFDQAQTLSKDLPVLHLGQESFLQDWALPETIYGKQVSYCTP